MIKWENLKRINKLCNEILFPLACSRRRQALERAGRTDVSLHCSTEGNYEELQCDNGLCWCVETTTGKPTQRAYPESMMTYLPCCELSIKIMIAGFIFDPIVSFIR